MIRRNIAGQKFGKLTAIEFKKINKHSYWKCLCDCGKVVYISLGNLTSNRQKSCGCWRSEQSSKHHKYGTRIYRIWGAMIQRCHNPKNSAYKYYGLRGILVCENWRNFLSFYKDMGDPLPNYTIERIDNSQGYNLKNCKWATRKEQSNNTRTTNFYIFQGEQKTLSQWADFFNVSRELIRSRLRRGKSFEQIATDLISFY